MEQKITDAISLSIILTPIVFGVFAIVNASFYYTMDHSSSLYVESTGPSMKINQIPGGYAISAINDTVKPSNLTTVIEHVGSFNNSLIVRFNYTTAEQGLGIDYFQCTIDNTNWGECSSPYVLELSNFDRNSNHTLEIRAVDMKGNIESMPAVVFFPLDNTSTTVK